MNEIIPLEINITDSGLSFFTADVLVSDPLNGSFLRVAFDIPDQVIHTSTKAFEYPRSDIPGYIHYVGPILLPPVKDFMHQNGVRSLIPGPPELSYFCSLQS